MEQTSVAMLTKDMRFEGFLLVRASEQRTANSGSKYLDMTLSDRTGEINAKVWDGTQLPPAVGTVLKVRGGVLDYNGRLQFRVERLRAAVPSDDVDMTLLTPCAPEKPEVMRARIDAAVAGIHSDDIRRVVLEALVLAGDKLAYYPAAQKIHHAERSGLLHHTSGMLALAQAVLPIYPNLNADLLIAGVVLHDLCKIGEMASDELGVVRDYTAEGLLIGHIARGVVMIEKAAERAGVTGEAVLLLQHMMLSHHGEEAYGSPRKPMFPEAEMLHWIDLIDARMNEMTGALTKIGKGAFTERIWSLERRLYRPDYDALTGEDAGDGAE